MAIPEALCVEPRMGHRALAGVGGEQRDPAHGSDLAARIALARDPFDEAGDASAHLIALGPLGHRRDPTPASLEGLGHDVELVADRRAQTHPRHDHALVVGPVQVRPPSSAITCPVR